MNKIVKKMWLMALRSDQYVQGKGTLVRKPYTSRNKTGNHLFCCLGVLTNIMHEQKGTEFKECDWVKGFLPDEVREWSGNLKSAEYELARLNDGSWASSGGGKSFKQIANWIEKNL